MHKRFKMYANLTTALSEVTVEQVPTFYVTLYRLMPKYYNLGALWEKACHCPI